MFDFNIQTVFKINKKSRHELELLQIKKKIELSYRIEFIKTNFYFRIFYFGVEKLRRLSCSCLRENW